MTFTLRGNEHLARTRWKYFAKDLEEFRGHPGEPPIAGFRFSSRAADTADQLIVRGEELAPLLAPAAAVICAETRRAAANGDRHQLWPVELHTVLMLAACAACGGDVPAAAFDDARKILFLTTTRHDDERMADHWNRCLAAIALEAPRVYRPMLGQAGASELPFTPGQVFTGNLYGLCTHLAAACERGAPLHDVRPAWADFIHHFHILEDAKSASPATLIWVFWILHLRLAHQPLRSFPQALHDTLYALDAAYQQAAAAPTT